MIEHRPYADLGRFDNDWLAARYHFSFANYHRPERDGWGSLLVWNDDLIRAGTGFPQHAHRDMEIITYVREGAIAHCDSLGNEGRTVAGDVQVMSAGAGIQHAEFNVEPEDTRIFQIWIAPSAAGHAARWETRSFPRGDRTDALITLASGDKSDAGAVRINQDARVLGAALSEGASVSQGFAPGRFGYLVPARGRVLVNGIEANARDGVAVRDLERLDIRALEPSEILLVDVPPLD